MPSNSTCETCRWWVQDETHDDIGSCHRNPPQIDHLYNLALQLVADERDDDEEAVEYLTRNIVRYQYDSTPNGAFPTVSSEDFCGEHIPGTHPTPESSPPPSA